MKGIQLYKLYKIGDVRNGYYCLVKKPEKKDDRCPRDDSVRAGRGCPCAILLLWFSMAASSP